MWSASHRVWNTVMCTINGHSHYYYSIFILRHSINFALIRAQTRTYGVMPCPLCLDSCPSHLSSPQVCWAWFWVRRLLTPFSWGRQSFRAPSSIWMGLGSRSSFTGPQGHISLPAWTVKPLSLIPETHGCALRAATAAAESLLFLL